MGLKKIFLFISCCLFIVRELICTEWNGKNQCYFKRCIFGRGD